MPTYITKADTIQTALENLIEGAVDLYGFSTSALSSIVEREEVTAGCHVGYITTDITYTVLIKDISDGADGIWMIDYALLNDNQEVEVPKSTRPN